jgi:hypothetical protein
MIETIEILGALFGGMIIVPVAIWYGAVWGLTSNKV